jgi:hypothetical protein
LQKLVDTTTMVFASASPAQLQDGIRQLVAPAYWNNLAGYGKPDVATQRIGATYPMPCSSVPSNACATARQ